MTETVTIVIFSTGDGDHKKNIFFWSEVIISPLKTVPKSQALPQTFAGTCRKLPSRVTANLIGELPQTSVESYRKLMSRVTANLCRELPQTSVES